MKKQLLIFVMSSFLLMAGCSMLEKSKGSEEDNEVNVVEGSTDNSVVESGDSAIEASTEDLKADKEAYDNAKENGDISSCDDLKTERLRNDCAFDIVVEKAVSQKSSKLCQQLKDLKYREKCESQVSSVEGPDMN